MIKAKTAGYIKMVQIRSFFAFSKVIFKAFQEVRVLKNGFGAGTQFVGWF